MEVLSRVLEPDLRFGFNQPLDDPRDGLTLFGPLDEGAPYGIRAGVVGTQAGIDRLTKWLGNIQRPVTDTPPSFARPIFPGFEAVFGITWSPIPAVAIPVDAQLLADAIHIEDKHQRVYQAVDLYASPIQNFRRTDDAVIDVWFVVVPDDVYRYGRPQSVVPATDRVANPSAMSVSLANALRNQSSMFPEDYKAAQAYYYEVNFHNQLKARLLGHSAVIQIVRESTIAHLDFLDRFGEPLRKLDPMQTAIAWNLTTTAFYKAGGRPWKLASIRDGVCYLGLVFKQDTTNEDQRIACCAAQMFLDSGDGVVFKGAVGPWYSPQDHSYHLTHKAAVQLVGMAIDSYVASVGHPPKQLFVHGKTRFDDIEWAGFAEAVGTSTELIGVRIRESDDIRLYRLGKHAVLRGMAYTRDQRTAYLWTRGFIPRLQTYPGREVPRPLLIDIARGDPDMQTVLADVLALTKLNYNACVYADGVPVTLKFANAVGEILTAGPTGDVPPLPFKYYI